MSLSLCSKTTGRLQLGCEPSVLRVCWRTLPAGWTFAVRRPTGATADREIAFTNLHNTRPLMKMDSLQRLSWQRPEADSTFH